MKLFLVIIALVFVQTTFAGECKLSIDRKACKGKKEEALKPYNMINPTEVKKPAKDVAECEAMAAKDASIIRRDVLHSKTVKAQFDGKDVKTASDKTDCPEDK